MIGSDLMGSVVKRAGLADFSPDQLALLAHGRGLDTTRMRAVLGFSPTLTTREAFLTYAENLSPVIPGPSRRSTPRCMSPPPAPEWSAR